MILKSGLGWLVALVLSSSAHGGCIDTVEQDTPTHSFQVAGAIARHNSSGLMWSRCRLGLVWDAGTQHCKLIPGQAQTFTWLDAQVAAKASQLEGFNDWRLPNKNELMSVVEHACTGPSINEAVFPDTPLDAFWTSSPSSIDVGYAWRLRFISGDMTTDDMAKKYYVRLVRTP